MNAKLRAIPAALNRARRRAGLDRNPMCRHEDRTQSAAGTILTMAFLVSGPWAAISTGDGVYHSGLRAKRTESAQRHMVTTKVTGPGWDHGCAWADIKWGLRGNRPEQG